MSLIAVDDTTFRAQLKGHSHVVVKYYADWCGSCKLFAPKYKRISADERFKDITFLDVNAENSPEARKAGNVKNLPTFAIFKEGEFVEAVSTNNEESLLQLINKLV